MEGDDWIIEMVWYSLDGCYDFLRAENALTPYGFISVKETEETRR